MNRPSMKITWMILVIVSALVASCGRNARGPETPATADAGAQVPAQPNAAGTASPADEEPTAAPPTEAATPWVSPTPLNPEKTVTTDSGLQYTPVAEGSGDMPERGDVVAVHYTGTLEDGTVFDSSYNRGEPIEFVLGAGQVIAGWDEGISLMHQGGQAVLVIPPDLAYGEQGAGDIIPSNATLIFDVELVEVREGAPSQPTAVDESAYEELDSGLQYYDIEVGDGPSPKPGQVVVVHYTGWLQDGGKFDSSLDRGEPFSFNIGMGQVIGGWDQGVATMKVGGKRQLVIPPDLGYGERGAGNVIPPNATLVFDVELLEVR